VHTRER